MRWPARSPVATMPRMDAGREGSQQRFVLPERVLALRFEKATTLQQTDDPLGGGFGDVAHVRVGQWRRRAKGGFAAGTGDKNTVGHKHMKVRIYINITLSNTHRSH